MPGLPPVHSTPVRLIEYASWSKPTIPYGDQITLTPKIAAEDTTLTVSNADGGRTTFSVPSGTEIELHVTGLHYNCTLSVRCIHGVQLLIMSCSAVLEGSSCQSGSLVTGRRTPLFYSVNVCVVEIMIWDHIAAARTCLRRRYELPWRNSRQRVQILHLGLVKLRV